MSLDIRRTVLYGFQRFSALVRWLKIKPPQWLRRTAVSGLEKNGENGRKRRKTVRPSLPGIRPVAILQVGREVGPEAGSALGGLLG